MNAQRAPRRLVQLAALLPCGLVLAQSDSIAGSGDRHSLLCDIPLVFVQNDGQWDKDVRFIARKGPLTACFEATSMTVVQWGESNGVAIRLSFEGASGQGAIEGEDPLPGIYNYFVGDRSTWRTNVPGFASLLYHELYDGVDLRVRDRNGRLEYDVLLETASALEQVVVRCDGAKSLAVDEEGNLVLTTALGELTQRPPVTWQVLPDDRCRPVECRYLRIDDVRYGFLAPESDPDLPLVIDPGLEWGTFLGSIMNESVQDVFVAGNGDVVACGQTYSGAFPTTPGAYQTIKAGRADAYLVRMDPEATGAAQLVYSTFTGGSEDDRANSCSVDDQGVFTVVGWTESADFPTTPGAYDVTHDGMRDVFVCQLDPSQVGLNQLVFSTLVGHDQTEHGNDHHLDAGGLITVLGWTESVGFPTTANAYDTSHNGGADAYVLRLDPALSGNDQLLYSTFLGGTGDEKMFTNTLDVDDAGVATLCGWTLSGDFPTKAFAYQPDWNGEEDAFVSRLDPALVGADQLVASTYFGGSLGDDSGSIDVDSSGTVTIGGWTMSGDLPTTLGAFQPAHSAPGAFDGYVARLDRTLSSLIASTFLGGAVADEGVNGLSAAGSGLVTVVGSVGSSDFPTTEGAYEETFQGGGTIYGPYDAFVSRLDPNLEKLLYSTFLGGAADQDFAYVTMVDEELAAIVAGVTQASDFPTSPGAYDTTHARWDDGFLTKLSMLPTGVERYGASTAGCLGSIAISVSSMPKSGNLDFEVLCANAPASGVGVLAFSVGKLDPPFTILGVDVWIDPGQLIPPLLTASSDNAGYCEVDVPIPASILPGTQVYAQFLWLPNPCGGQGFSASNALDITVQ